MPPVGLEPTIPAGERPENYALNRVAPGPVYTPYYDELILTLNLNNSLIFAYCCRFNLLSSNNYFSGVSDKYFTTISFHIYCLNTYLNASDTCSALPATGHAALNNGRQSSYNTQRLFTPGLLIILHRIHGKKTLHKNTLNPDFSLRSWSSRGLRSSRSLLSVDR